MVKKQFYILRQDGVALYKFASDKGLKIQKVGTNEIYTEAIDVETANFRYKETDEPIEKYKG